MTFGVVMAGSPGPTDPALQAEYNAQNFYASEHGNGMSNALVGAIIGGIGFFTGHWWLIAIGVVVLAYGLSRMSRASATYEKAQLDFAKSMLQG